MAKKRRLAILLPTLLAIGVACGAPDRGARPAQGAPTTSSPASAPAGADAGDTAPARSDLPADLLARASVGVEQARRTARDRLPAAAITSEELEEEGGRLIYTFELTTPGKSGIDEVNVDAVDGSIVSVQHEGPAEEKAESEAEAKGRH